MGKTVIATALCRIFKQDGLRVVPFKSQNMTSNTALLESGGEIAVSQFIQAIAADVEPDTRMNPVIIKPSPDGQGSQVLLNGSCFDTIRDGNYMEIRKALLPEIKKAYDSLSGQYDVIVIEGAGSPVELNLNDGEIVNIRIAELAQAPVLLVSDIDRGGVFASLYGTVNLLSEAERRFFKALIVNRFRGDLSLFTDGMNILEHITGLPVAGVVPYCDIDLPEEDGETDGAKCSVMASVSGEQLDVIADHVRLALDMRLIYAILNSGLDTARAKQ